MEPSRSRTSGKRSAPPPEVVDLTKDDSVIIPISPCEIITLDGSPEPPPKRSRLAPKPTPPVPPRPDTPPNALKCPICIETLANVKKRGLKIVVTRCGHIFCDFCLKKALQENGRKCPKCRKAVPKGPTGIIEIFDVA